jgi:hypothetical protein
LWRVRVTRITRAHDAVSPRGLLGGMIAGS